MRRADGTVESEGRTLLELEDVVRTYKHPSIIDIKVSTLRTLRQSQGQSQGQGQTTPGEEP